MKVIFVYEDGEVRVINPEKLDFADKSAESSCSFVPDIPGGAEFWELLRRRRP